MTQFNHRNEYKEILQQRQNRPFSYDEMEIIQTIKKETVQKNVDNISRTDSYFYFYQKHTEIKWAFLASMVSRNAGWNMTDLEGQWFPKVLPPKKRGILFHTYERANWLIFHDIYPQLMIYKQSKVVQKPLFHLLKAFHVSTYMEIEWMRFWKYHDKRRLMTSLIVNEQHVIQKPVIEHPFYKKKVFTSLTFQIQDWLHFSGVLFPTLTGELYGFSTTDFTNVKARIELGKKLAWLLFNKKYYDLFYAFSKRTTHTGSRYDYEQYQRSKKGRETPFLRVEFPIISHQQKNQKDWYHGQASVEKFQSEPKILGSYELTDWYKKKQLQLQIGILLNCLLKQ